MNKLVLGGEDAKGFYLRVHTLSDPHNKYSV